MTLVPNLPGGPGGERAGHIGELRLRRHHIGELAGPERDQVTAHLGACADCRLRLQSLQDEQRAFTNEIPFDRFAGGVERAARVPRARPSPRRALLAGGGLAFAAAAAALLLVVRPGGAPEELRPFGSGGNRLKGGAFAAQIQVASADGRQQAVDPGTVTALRAGDRLRIGYRSESPRHLIVIAVDDAGAVTPLHPEVGDSLPVPTATTFSYLPGSIELTGAGRERIYLLLAEQPFALEAVVIAAGAEHARRAGDLSAMGPLTVGASPSLMTFSWLFGKP